MNVKTTQRPPLLIVCLGLFGMDRRYADRSVRGIGVLRERLERLTALYAFGSLSRCFSVLCADRSAWRDAPRTSLLCLAQPR